LQEHSFVFFKKTLFHSSTTYITTWVPLFIIINIVDLIFISITFKGGPMKKRLPFIAFFAILVFFSQNAVQAEMGKIPYDDIDGPTCVVRDTSNGKTLPLSPEFSQYNVIVTDGIAHITVTQQYKNRIRNCHEIAYVFPLPHEGSVHAMSMEYRDVTYKARIYEKEEAKQVYDSIKESGGNAALLLQERPNVFQQRLANIAYGDSASITIELSMPLKYDNGEYELSIPTMVAERYQSDGASPVPPSGDLWNPPENIAGQRLEINVLIQTGYPITDLNSPTHPLTISQVAETRADLIDRGLIHEETDISMPYAFSGLLRTTSTYPNRDFVLRFGRQQAVRDFTLASYYDTTRSQGYFACNLFPDTNEFSGSRPDLEIVLLIDISGSQNGWPLQKEKEIADTIISRLATTDRLNVLSFNTDVEWAFGTHEPKTVSAETVLQAKQFINSLTSSGGTDLYKGVCEALNAPATTEHRRFYIFLTDGFITNESAIFDTIKNHPSKPTIFTFGAGNNLNRYFLDESARIGNGFAAEVTQNEAVGPLVDNAWAKIASPQLKNVRISIDGAGISNLIIPTGNTLYKACPVSIYGTYTTAGTYSVAVKGFRNGQEVVLQKSIALTNNPTANNALPQMWARQKIRDLRIDEGTTTKNKEKIIQLSLEHQVLCKYTAFLAFNPEQSEDDHPVYLDTDRHSSSLENKGSFSMNHTKRAITLHLPKDVHLHSFEVYDLQGRMLYTYNHKGMPLNSFLWDMRLPNGRRLRPGRYIIVCKANTQSFVRMLSIQ